MYQLFIVMYISYLSVPNKLHLSKAGHNFAIAIELYHPFVTLGRLVDFLYWKRTLLSEYRFWGIVTKLNKISFTCPKQVLISALAHKIISSLCHLGPIGRLSYWKRTLLSDCFVRGRVTNLNNFHVICYLFHLGRFGKICCPSENIHGKYWACPKQGCFIVPL